MKISYGTFVNRIREVVALAGGESQIDASIDGIDHFQLARLLEERFQFSFPSDFFNLLSEEDSPWTDVRSVIQSMKKFIDVEDEVEVLTEPSGQDKHFAGQAQRMSHSANMTFEEAIQYAEGIVDPQLRNLTLTAVNAALQQMINHLAAVAERHT